MEYEAPKSRCLLCDSEYTGRGIGRHLSSCIKKKLAGGDGNELAGDYYHIAVQAAYDRDFFLHLLVSCNTTLEELDDFLRKIWLECCGHMSAFSRGKWREELNLSSRVKDIAREGDVLLYQYDFGSTTELLIKFAKVYRQVARGKENIQVLARNAQPIVPCDECGKYPAVNICTECQWDGGGWLCEKCSHNHECGDEMFLPVVNSPRAGVCAYEGEIEERPIPKHLKAAIQAGKKGKIVPIK